MIIDKKYFAESFEDILAEAKERKPKYVNGEIDYISPITYGIYHLDPEPGMENVEGEWIQFNCVPFTEGAKSENILGICIEGAYYEENSEGEDQAFTMYVGNYLLSDEEKAKVKELVEYFKAKYPTAESLGFQPRSSYWRKTTPEEMEELEEILSRAREKGGED